MNIDYYLLCGRIKWEPVTQNTNRLKSPLKQMIIKRNRMDSSLTEG